MIADEEFPGLLCDKEYPQDKKFPGGQPAKEINFFGKLSLKRGISVLAEALKLDVCVGGNNAVSGETLPKGAVVYYHPTPGSLRNLLWADQWPK
jgi:hypothetical protein